jgi:hypothetical protein
VRGEKPLEEKRANRQELRVPKLKRTGEGEKDEMENFEEDELGLKNLPLCREPWQSYYILRRGILPCCHGEKPIAPMSEWATAWNSPALQEIRRYLSQGKLSPYCLSSLGCPIVQKYLERKKQELKLAALSPQTRPRWMRLVNRLLLGLPARIYRSLQK